MKKRIKKLFNEDTIYLDLEANTKEGIIEEIINRLVEKEKVINRDAALKAVLERENKMSTGMENGIAIPHGKSEEINEMVAAFGRTSHGVDFKSIDNQPAHIYIMTISSLKHSGPHLQLLAEVAKILRDSQVRQKLLTAESAQDVINIFLQKEK